MGALQSLANTTAAAAATTTTATTTTTTAATASKSGQPDVMAAAEADTKAATELGSDAKHSASPAASAAASAPPSEADVALAVSHMNAFAMRLVHRLVFAYPPNTSTPKELEKLEREKASPSSIVVSPVSVYLMLSMLTAGSSGKTRAELQRAILQRTDKSDADMAKIYGAVNAALRSLDRDAVLTIANAIFASTAIKPSYVHLLTAFNAQARPLTTAAAINDWVTTATDGQIQQLFSANELPASTKAVLASANFFHCPWTTPFNPKLTTDQKFWTAEPATATTPTATATATATGASFVRCAMMRSERSDWLVSETESFSALEMPCGVNRKFAVLIVTPTKRCTAEAVLDSLLSSESNGVPLNAVVNAVRSAAPRKGVVLLPRFRAAFGCDLVQPMTSLGVHRAFVAAIAEFAPMCGAEACGVDQMVTRAVLQFSESGVTAAAASATTVATLVKPTPVPPADELLRVDAPFCVFVHDTALGALLFAALVKGPAVAAAATAHPTANASATTSA